MPEIPLSVSEKAGNIQATLNTTVNGLRADKELTADAKRRRLAAAYLTAEQQMQQLRTSWQGNSATQAKVLTKDIFGAVTGGDLEAIMAARDATDFAYNRISDPTEAL